MRIGISASRFIWKSINSRSPLLPRQRRYGSRWWLQDCSTYVSASTGSTNSKASAFDPTDNYPRIMIPLVNIGCHLLFVGRISNILPNTHMVSQGRIWWVIRRNDITLFQDNINKYMQRNHGSSTATMGCPKNHEVNESIGTWRVRNIRNWQVLVYACIGQSINPCLYINLHFKKRTKIKNKVIRLSPKFKCHWSMMVMALQYL